MKKQITKNFSAFNKLIILFFLIFAISCQKRIIQNPGKTIVTTGSNIIYTDVNPDSVILKLSTDSFNLDLNNDGITDFVFNRSYITWIAKCGRSGFQMSATHIALSLKPASGSNSIMTSGSGIAQAQALDSSTAITPDSLWSTTSQDLLQGTITPTTLCILPAIGGYWLNVSDKYLGLKFIINNITHYGWARLSSSYSVSTTSSGSLIIGQLILKDYAYNIIPNQPILAGQTK